mmetsp:Transcript_32493/g.58736  ORF Transcript_32493/g.58736 Transcript_32493/m.58736 type:complete len:137 (+) Transcript_32493:1-411(+)
MHVKGRAPSGKKDDPPPILVFGVIQDDSLMLMKKDEARHQHEFPWDFRQDSEDVRGFDNGIMLRKVKWHRQGILQEVRGRSQADWLIENVTKWLVKVKGNEDKLLRKALQKMTCKKFIANTKVIEEAWVDYGLTGM